MLLVSKILLGLLLLLFAQFCCLEEGKYFKQRLKKHTITLYLEIFNMQNIIFISKPQVH